MSRRPRLLSPLRPTAKPETTAEETTAEDKAPAERAPADRASAENSAENSPAVENVALEQTDRGTRTARKRGGAHARGRRSRTGRSTIWKAVFAIIFLALLATAVALVLLQSAGVINWGILGPNA